MKKILLITSLSALFALANGNALAAKADANECRDLTKTTCSSKDSCTWVDGYTRKSGKVIKSYCRSKGKHSNKSKDSATPAKATDNNKKSAEQQAPAAKAKATTDKAKSKKAKATAKPKKEKKPTKGTSSN